MKLRTPWTAEQLAALHAEHLAGVYVCALAARRHRRSGDLVAAWQTMGLSPLQKKPGSGRKRKISQATADVAHAEYMAGASLRDCERRHGIRKSTLRTAFVKRGYALRGAETSRQRHAPNGTFAPFVPKTSAEIEALIQAATAVVIPAEIVTEWRAWDRHRRADFIARLRAKIQDPHDRPDLPFSANVAPFDYSSEAAWEILARRNSGRGSRDWRTKLDIRSQGVIWDGRLWFWNRRTRCYLEGVPWTPEAGRPVLSRVVYATENGGQIPPGMVIRHRDRNPNNFAPANLYLATKNDVLRETQAKHFTARSRALTAAFLRRSQTNQSNPTKPLP